MLRRFLRESALYGASNALARGIALMLVPIYTRVLTPSDIGVVDLVALIGNLANLALALEISQAVARYYPAGASHRAAYASTALWFTIGAYSIALAGGWAVASPFATWLFETPGHDAVLTIALPALWANGIFYFLQNQLRWQLQPRAYAVASLIYAVVHASATLVLLLHAEIGIVAVFWGQLAAAVSAILYAAFACGASLRPTFDMAKLGQMLGFSAPLVVSSVAVLATGYADRIIVKELMSVSDLGVYGLAQRLAAAVTLLLSGFQATITPLVTHFGTDASTPAQVGRAWRYFLAVSLPCVLALGIFSRELVAIFATPAYQAAHALVPILAGALLIAGSYVFVPGLWLAKKTGTTMLINVAAAAIGISLNLAWIPSLGLLGAALAALAAATCALGANIALGSRYFAVPIVGARTLGAVALLAALLAFGASVDRLSIGAFALRSVLWLCGSAAMAAIVLGGAEMRRIAVGMRPAAGR